MKYQTPHGAILSKEPQEGALYLGMICREGVWHQIAVLVEKGDEVLVSGETFYGWVKLLEVVQGD